MLSCVQNRNVAVGATAGDWGIQYSVCSLFAGFEATSQAFVWGDSTSTVSIVGQFEHNKPRDFDALRNQSVNASEASLIPDLKPKKIT